MKQLFLPVGLVLAIAAGSAVPGLGMAVGAIRFGPLSAMHILVIVIFLISGYKLKSGDMASGGTLAIVFVAAALINLLGGPIVAMSIQAVVPLSLGVYVGVAAMSCVPPTLSSCIVISKNAGGDELLALVVNVGLAFLGTLVLPFTVGWCLDVGASIQIEVWPLFLKIVKLVVAPMVVGAIFKRYSRGWTHGTLDYIPSLCVVLTVWIAISAKAETLYQASAVLLLTMAGVALAVHCALMVMAWVTGKALRLAPDAAVPLLFVASQKTLPLALTVLIALPDSRIDGGIKGVAVLACIIFHFSQILLDSGIAGYLAKKKSQ